jgi:anti-sigma factor RsiW
MTAIAIAIATGVEVGVGASAGVHIVMRRRALMPAESLARLSVRRKRVARRPSLPRLIRRLPMRHLYHVRHPHVAANSRRILMPAARWPQTWSGPGASASQKFS